MSDKKFNNMNIQYNRPLISVQDIVRYIDKGEKFTKESETADEMDLLGAIVLNPTYQRVYKSTIPEESTIVESILLNIPIPEIFLVKVINNASQIRNVMDGKHRLNAIFRYVKGIYPLQGLKLLPEDYNEKYFKDLSNEDKIKILTYNISVLEFDPLDNDELEIELFTRYNKQTKTLEPQEIRYATYYSETSNYVSNFISSLEKDSALAKAYNITKSRVNYQRVHQNLFTLLYILENGLNVHFSQSTELAEKYMQDKSAEYKLSTEIVRDTKELFCDFNNFILVLTKYIEYPFSSQVYGEEIKRNYLFQTGIAMTIAALFHYCTFDLDGTGLIQEISNLLYKTHLKDDLYKGSSTSSRTIAKYLLEIFTHWNYKKIMLKDGIIEVLTNELKLIDKNEK